MDENVRFVIARQLKNRAYWNKFCEVFSTKEDTADEGWRAEYFGKMMRGAVWIYLYSRDEELYDVMTEAVLNMLPRQEENGRFSSYTQEKEFTGWDVWGRKYLLTGMLHYCDVCRDEALKTRIVQAMERHVDYMIAHIGSEEGRIAITATSEWWSGVNSCSVLEPVVELYRRTGKAEYLAFAKYIISTGGCADGDLVALALEGKKLPHEYPVVKAYEVMSFFEGLLAYYEVTGEEPYYRAVCNFAEGVQAGDITAIGCAGCTHECFDNAALRQTEYSDVIMQETCVTVTWMRLLFRLYRLSGKACYIDRLECSGWNALYGSLNTEGNEQYSFERRAYLPAMAFDSYSPLYMNKRGRGIGGFKEFASGGYFGCCAAIGACGIALMPMTALMQDEDGSLIVNALCDGEAQADGFSVCVKSAYPRDAKGTITVFCEGERELCIRIRRPAWCPVLTVNGRRFSKEDFCTVRGTFRSGDTIDVAYELSLRAVRLNGKIAFFYGPLALAADALKTERDIRRPVRLGGRQPVFRVLPPAAGELVRIALKTADGELLLTDYASCGKQWLNENAILSVWLDEET